MIFNGWDQGYKIAFLRRLKQKSSSCKCERDLQGRYNLCSCGSFLGKTSVHIDFQASNKGWPDVYMYVKPYFQKKKVSSFAATLQKLRSKLLMGGSYQWCPMEFLTVALNF